MLRAVQRARKQGIPDELYARPRTSLGTPHYAAGARNDLIGHMLNQRRGIDIASYDETETFHFRWRTSKHQINPATRLIASANIPVV